LEKIIIAKNVQDLFH